MGSKSPDFLRVGSTAKSVDKTSRTKGERVAGADQHPPVGFARSNRAIAFVLIAITLAIGLYIWNSDWAQREVRDGFKLGSFPMFAVILMLLSLLLMAFDSKSRKTTDGIRDFKLLEGAIVLGLLAGLGGLFLLIPVLGFAVVIFVIVFFGSILLGFRPVWIAFLAALATAAALHGLTILLNVQFPVGLLSILGA